MSTLSSPDVPGPLPVRLATTALTWDDLVLPLAVMAEIEHIVVWAEHRDTVLRDWGFGRVTKPGYRALFSGPPGTGKTLAAALIGKRLEREVFRVDLPAIATGYIGETEKNLSRLLDRAREESWILLFDEADALFGKRTGVSDSHDRYANQEVSYLLQRMEEFEGLVILTTHLADKLDAAFMRRFQSVVSFPLPGPELRLRLWKGVLPDADRLASDVDLEEMARSHQLTGGAIVEAARYGAVHALGRGEDRVTRQDLTEGVRRELGKDRRSR